VVRGYDSEGLFELDPTTRPHEWAMIRLDGRMLRRGGRTALDGGAQLELLAVNTGEVVHTLAYEVREDPDANGP
jgi:hypothetical protein